MKTRMCDDDSYWACEITLNESEWPTLDEQYDWVNRPIRRWVLGHCRHTSFFAADGLILFKKYEDAILFKLTWEI